MADTTSEAPTRRDFLYVATGAVGAMTVGQIAWPFIDQMNADASVRALASIEVDVASLAEGSQLTVKWRGKPVFIRHRTAKEIEESRAVALADLKDTDARNANKHGKDGQSLDARDENRSLDPEGKWLVMLGVCTHLGCVPIGDAGDFGGWFCPCHGSHYDSSGRIRKGPAPENLPVPQAKFISDTVIKLG